MTAFNGEGQPPQNIKLRGTDQVFLASERQRPLEAGLCALPRPCPAVDRGGGPWDPVTERHLDGLRRE